MRLIVTLSNIELAKAFSASLLHQGIENQCEIVKGTAEDTPILCRIWVFDEDQVAEARQSFQEFLQNTKDLSFEGEKRKTQTPPSSQQKTSLQKNSFAVEPLGTVTLLILLFCGLLYFAIQLTAPKREAIPSTIPYVPLFASPIKKEMLYDYPYAYTLIDTLISLYGEGSLQNPSTLSTEGRILLDKFYQTPYWQGIYDKIVAFFQTDTPMTFNAPVFEKIRQGQIWRLVSPCFLHADMFHLFFNMIWLIIIGKQLEMRLGVLRYLLFILLAGIFSNTAQYLMSGSNFIGLSGVLCAMIVFVWARQKRAPWEGYFMQPATWHFLVFFILLMFTLQIASFFMEITGHLPYAINIANTAHLSGAFIGYVFGGLKFFTAKR